MIFNETKIKGAYVIDIKPIEDERGFFARGFCRKEFADHGMDIDILQTNISYNKYKGTLRGMHLQLAPYGEKKLVRCTRGAIYDVIVDLRSDSETFKQWLGLELTAKNYRMLLVPEGCAHGYLTLEDDTDTTYQVTQYYTGSHETGVRWNDPAFNIEWPVEPKIISERDRNHADFSIHSAYFELALDQNIS
jgi:dTDP-4-dehydrorhamnose 3,5-epimerase